MELEIIIKAIKTYLENLKTLWGDELGILGQKGLGVRVRVLE